MLSKEAICGDKITLKPALAGALSGSRWESSRHTPILPKWMGRGYLLPIFLPSAGLGNQRASRSPEMVP